MSEHSEDADARPPRKVPCPTCGKEMVWSTGNPWRPFCSERCRLIDLGEWLTESKRIPGTEQPPPEPESDDEH